MPAFVLLVEDDLDLAAAIKMALEDEGWQVEHAADGETGLRRAESGEHELAILDVRLPGINGFDLCRQLRRSSNMPVLFLTARASETDKVVGLELTITWPSPSACGNSGPVSERSSAAPAHSPQMKNGFASMTC